MMKQLFLLYVLFTASIAFSQDVIVLDGENDNLNRSIANQFTIYSSPKPIATEKFNSGEALKNLTKRKLTQSVENLDFTSSHFYIWFKIKNATDLPQTLYFETARPITNKVTLQSIKNGEFDHSATQLSGDGIPFFKKSVATNRSVLHLKIDANSSQEYLLTLSSDGEVITLPMVFWSADMFEKIEQQRQFASGIFYGIFLFVILIYLSFFALLRDRLYLIYTLYVFFSGLLQFSLDGYAHEFLFHGGGYFTQHIVLFVAGFTVFFAYTYAAKYLELTGKLLRSSQILAYLVLATTFASLIPGTAYELCYPLINGFSLLSLLFILFAALRSRRQEKNVSLLFLFGLISLMVGAIVFILGNLSVIDIPILTQNSLKVGTLVEIICLSILMAGNYKKLQVEKEESQRLLLIELEEKNRISEEANVRLEKEVLARTEEIESQRALLSSKNEDLLASIQYAKRIQNAILPSDQKFKHILPESFVFFRPKDIVSGDFYWIEKIETTNAHSDHLAVYATADCTGHGVPGAFVSIVCNNLLKLGKTQPNVNTPGEALDFIDVEINQLLNSDFSNEAIRDGMDVSMCAINKQKGMLYFAGAKSGILLVRNGEIIEYKGDRKSIGYDQDQTKAPFTTHVIKLEPNDVIYSFTDGIVDQFGGPQGKKFMLKRLKILLRSIAHLSMEDQHNTIEDEFRFWQGDLDQVDDVLLIGIRV